MVEVIQPAKVIYGVYALHESFAVYGEDELRELAAEISVVTGCQTVGEIREALPSLRAVGSPVYGDELDDRPDDEPWNWKDAGPVIDGDWPPMPTSAIDHLFSKTDKIWDVLRVQAGAEHVETVLNGWYWHIPLEREAELLEILAANNLHPVRDDALIREVAGPE